MTVSGWQVTGGELFDRIVSKGSYSERARRRRPARPRPIPRMGAFSPYWLALLTRAMTRAVGPSVSLGIHIRGSQSRAKANAPFGIPCRTDIILQGNTVSFGIRLFDVKGLGRIKRFCTICAGSVGSNEASPICARLLTRQGHRPPRSQGKLRLTPSSPSSPSSSVRPRPGSLDAIQCPGRFRRPVQPEIL